MKKFCTLICFNIFIFVMTAAEPVKVISLSPAVTDMLLAIGGRENLAGRSSACDAPQALDIPVAGDMGKPFTEPVLKSGARLILSDTRAPGPQWDVLQKCGMRIEIVPAASIADLPRNIRRIGELINKKDAAEKVAANLEKDIAYLQKSPPRVRCRTLLVLGLPPAVSCGKGSFITDSMTLAGAENIAARAQGTYFVLSTEQIVSAMPELIISFAPQSATEKYFSRAEFRTIPAVKMQKIIYPPIEKFCRLTPALPQALRELRSTIERDFLQKQP